MQGHPRVQHCCHHHSPRTESPLNVLAKNWGRMVTSTNSPGTVRISLNKDAIAKVAKASLTLGVMGLAALFALKVVFVIASTFPLVTMLAAGTLLGMKLADKR